MNNIQIFNNPDFGEIRTVEIDNEVWFIAKDISDRLGYAQTANMLKQVQTEDKIKIASSNLDDTFSKFTKEVAAINESGLYDAVFGSKLKNAKTFRHWVTSEVLPSIRKTGSYNAPPMTIPEQIQLLAQGNVELNQRMDNMQSEIESIKFDLPILPVEADKITTAVKKKGTSVLGGKHTNAYQNRGLRQRVYCNIYSNLKYNFGVTSYKNIKRNECDKAIEVINNYQTPLFLQQDIESENAQQIFDF